MASTARAKRVGKSLKAELAALGIEITHSASLEAVSRMYGYADWRGLVRSVRGNDASPDDRDVPDAERAARRALHVAVLERLGLGRPVAEEVVGRIRPTDRISGERRTCRRSAQTTEALRILDGIAREGNWPMLGGNALFAMERTPKDERAPFVEYLEMAASHDVRSALNHALAHVFGDAGPGLVDEGRQLLLAVLARPEIKAHPVSAGMALCVLGDIVSGGHGGTADPVGADRLYRRAYEEFGSAQGAFNVAVAMERRNGSGSSPETARLYRFASDAGLAMASTNLAVMILKGRAAGGFSEIETLLRKAHAGGDQIAGQNLEMLLPHREGFARSRAADAILEAEGIDPRAIKEAAEDIDAATWSSVMRDFGWVFADEWPGDVEEGGLVGVALSGNGLSVPVHVTRLPHDGLADNLKRMVRDRHSGDGDVLVVFTGSADGWNGDRVDSLAFAELNVDGIWTTVHLRGGGLTDALRQRAAILANPSLIPASTFRDRRVTSAVARISAALEERCAAALPTESHDDDW